MKKLFTFILGLSFVLLLFGASYACETVHFDDGDVCIGINKNEDNYTLTKEITNYNGGGTPSLDCYVLLPNNHLESAGACNGSFHWDGNNTRKIVIYVQFNNDRDELEDNYDFYHGKWENDNTTSSDGELHNFSFYYVQDTTPNKNEWTTIRIKALDDNGDRLSDYDGYVKLHFERENNDADHYDLKIKSDDFNDDEYDLDSNGELEVRFNHGYLEFQVYFKYADDYKITVQDGSISKYKNFSVQDTNYNTYDTDNFKVTLSPANPQKNERVDLTVRAQDGTHLVNDYNHNIIFKIYYRTSPSSSWRRTSSSTYFEINDYNNRDRDYDDGIEFRSYRNGEYKFNNFIKFKKYYDYKIVVEEKSHPSIYGYNITSIEGDSNGSEESDVSGFSNDELETVDRIYRIRPTLISKFKKEYYILAINNTRLELSNSLYEYMDDIINDQDNRIINNYDEFFDVFSDWYNYTVQIIH